MEVMFEETLMKTEFFGFLFISRCLKTTNQAQNLLKTRHSV